MTIRQVKCPACGASANVPIAMASIKCASCGALWNPNQPGAVSRPAPASGSASTASRSTSKGTGTKLSGGLIAAIGGALAILAVAGITVVLLRGGTDVTTPPPPVVDAPPVTPAPVAVSQPVDTTPTYREVDLPESTRKQIYLDYRRLVESSTEKKIMVLKNSPVGQSVQGMLEKTVDREITHFSSIHNISREDVLEIVAEGDAKQWPGARPPETASSSGD